jgi:hypothetical protein
MTENQKYRIKAALIEGQLFKLLGMVQDKGHLWINDNGGSLTFSTNPLPARPELIVQKIKIPARASSGTTVFEPSRNEVLDFLKDLLGVGKPEAEDIIRRAQRAEGLPRVRVKLIKNEGVLTVSSTDFNQVGTDGRFIHGCSISNPMQIVATIGGAAALEINLVKNSDYSKFEEKKWYNLIYLEPTGTAIGIAPVRPA